MKRWGRSPPELLKKKNNIHAHSSNNSQHPCPLFMHITLYAPTILCDLLFTGYPIISTFHRGTFRRTARLAATRLKLPHRSTRSHNALAMYLSSNTQPERRVFAYAMNSCHICVSIFTFTIYAKLYVSLKVVVHGASGRTARAPPRRSWPSSPPSSRRRRGATSSIG
jgi:hypothetical protein